MRPLSLGWLGFACFGLGAIAVSEAHAQIVPDATLPQTSFVTPAANVLTITGGTQAGGNLFHSFREFSVPTGGTAFFNNAASIANIVTRVTGSSPSAIDGILKANGGANLFFLNPNGIVFGQNARLEIGGSFIASTANALQFADGTVFAATPNGTTPLLSVSVPLGLQMGANSGSITVRGAGDGTRTTADLIDTTSGLRVSPQATLGLLGNGVVMEGATLKTAGGRIEVGSVGSGTVGLVPVGDGLRFDYSAIAEFRDLSLTGGSAIDASGLGAGNVQVVARRLRVADGSQVESSTLGDREGGSLLVRAAEAIDLTGRGSGLFAQVYTGATGSGGDLQVSTARLSLSEGAFVSTTTAGEGKAGTLTIAASDRVDVAGTTADGVSSNITAEVDPEGEGEGGNLSLTTGTLSVRDGAFVSATTAGSGEAGALAIRAQTVEVVGTSPDGLGSSSISAQVNPNATGNGGLLAIDAANVSVRAGAFISTSTAGSGGAGLLAIAASEAIEVVGTSSDGKTPSAITAAVNPDATGGGGSLLLTTGKLSVRDGGQVGVSTFGQGDAGELAIAANTIELLGNGSNIAAQVGSDAEGEGGDLLITTGTLTLRDGAFINVDTFGQGSAGSLTIKASDTVTVDRGGGQTTAISANANAEASGTGGSLAIEAATVRVLNGGQISASTFGEGDAGELRITASNAIEVAGISGDGTAGSNITAEVNTQAKGDGGDLILTTRTLSVRDGGFISTDTSGFGKAGNLAITATESVTVDRGTAPLATYISADVNREAEGVGGSLTISTGTLSVRGGAFISTSTFGAGDAGAMAIEASKSVEVVGTSPDGSARSNISARVREGAAGDGGLLGIKTGTLSVRDGALVSADTEGNGEAGALIVQASELVEVVGTAADGTASAIAARVAVDAEGVGGLLGIETKRLSVRDGASVSTSTSGLGDAGDLVIVATDSVEVVGISRDGSLPSGILARVGENAEGDGGILSMETGRLSVRDGGQISTSTFGAGDAGILSVVASKSVEVVGASSALASSAQATSTGAGGFLSINTPYLLVDREAFVIVSDLAGEQGAGSLEITAGTIRVDNKGLISASAETGAEANIRLTATSIQLLNGGQIEANAFNDATGGNITIKTASLIGFPGTNILANAQQKGGRIDINAQSIFGFRALSRSEVQRLTGSEDLREFDPARDLPDTANIIAISTDNPDLNLSGEVTLTTPNVDPSQGIVTFAIAPIDASRLVVQRCSADALRGNEFIITGRGGIPLTPADLLRDYRLLENLGNPTPKGANESVPSSSRATPDRAAEAGELQEASGWNIAPDGKVTLVAARKVVPVNPGQIETCPAPGVR